MSLINCPECGKEISNKSKQCVHCGYPIEQNIELNTSCIIDGVSHDMTSVISHIKNGKFKDAFLCIRKITNMSIKNCMNIIEYIIDNNLPCEYSIKTYTKEDEEAAYKKLLSMKDDKIKTNMSKVCPKCGCTDFTPLRRKFSLLAGFATNKVDMVCNKCGTIVKWG